MIIYFGADHRGFELKERLKKIVLDGGYEIFDAGDDVFNEEDDYADFAMKVGEKVSQGPDSSRGVLICGSGAGMDIIANKFPRVRSTLGITSDQVYDARHDDDINVLCFSADATSQADAEKMLKVFLETPYGREERHARRLAKIADLETNLYK